MATATALEYGLTDEQVGQFHEEGFLRFDGLIRGEKLRHYKHVLDGLVERCRGYEKNVAQFCLQLDDDNNPIPGFLHKVQGVCVAEPRILDLAKEPEICEKVESLIGPDLDIFGTKFFPLLPHGGTSTAWHQDNFYFGTKRDGERADDTEMVTCGIYLEETTRENGCLKVVPRSHRAREILTHTNRPGRHGTGSWTEVDETAALDIECPAGTVILFSAYLLHAANANVSDRSRYSTAWHYIRADLDLVNFVRGEYDDIHLVRGTR